MKNQINEVRRIQQLAGIGELKEDNGIQFLLQSLYKLFPTLQIQQNNGNLNIIIKNKPIFQTNDQELIIAFIKGMIIGKTN
jgi:hypothetical protein